MLIYFTRQDTNEAKHCRETKHKLEETLDKLKKSMDEMTFALEKFSMEVKVDGLQNLYPTT